jgi:hypothetical protein
MEKPDAGRAEEKHAKKPPHIFSKAKQKKNKNNY